MSMSAFDLMQARSYSESVLINILTDLGAEVQFIMGHRRNTQMGPIGFQTFWPGEFGSDRGGYDPRAHANVIP